MSQRLSNDIHSHLKPSPQTLYHPWLIIIQMTPQGPTYLKNEECKIFLKCGPFAVASPSSPTQYITQFRTQRVTLQLTDSRILWTFVVTIPNRGSFLQTHACSYSFLSGISKSPINPNTLMIELNKTPEQISLSLPSTFIYCSFDNTIHLDQSFSFLNSKIQGLLGSDSLLDDSNGSRKTVPIRDVDAESSAVGIDAVLEMKRKAQQQHSNNLSTAFEDIQALTSKASQMVVLARRIANALEKENTDVETQTRQFRNYLLELGIDSPVTRKSASGSDFHSSLAKELSLFLSKLFPLQPPSFNAAVEASSLVPTFSTNPFFRQYRVGIPLIEAYFMLNRARGTNLISPNDFYVAVELLPKSGYPFVIASFGDRKMIFPSTFSPTVASNQIVSFIKSNGPQSPVSLSTLSQIPIHLIQYCCESAENNGLLCRDVTLLGTLFYPNLFISDNWDSYSPAGTDDNLLSTENPFSTDSNTETLREGSSTESTTSTTGNDWVLVDDFE